MHMLRVCIVIRIADNTSQWAASIANMCLTEMFMGLGNMHSEAAFKIGLKKSFGGAPR